MRIAINIIATNKYVSFLDTICQSIDMFFFVDNRVNVILHTNVDLDVNVFQKYPRITFIIHKIKHEPWPAPTLKRFHYFTSCKNFIEENDYCFYIDVDSIFVKPINEKILSSQGMIGTIHPSLFKGSGTPERNPISKAYIHHGAMNRYYCGGFFGGDSKSFLDFSETMKNNIDEDSDNGVTAIWHDESHLNRFFYENPPTTVLEYPFAIAEGLDYPKKDTCIVFLDKSKIGGHDFFRS